MKALTVLLLASLTTPAIANSVQELCASYGEAAESIMVNRQQGTDVSKLLAVSDDAVMQAMIFDAYKSTRFSSEPMQKKAVQDFRNNIVLTCHASFEGVKVEGGEK